MHTEPRNANNLVQSLGFETKGFEFKGFLPQGLEFNNQGMEFVLKVQGFNVQRLWFGVLLGFTVQGLESRVQGFYLGLVWSWSLGFIQCFEFGVFIGLQGIFRVWGNGACGQGYAAWNKEEWRWEAVYDDGVQGFMLL